MAVDLDDLPSGTAKQTVDVADSPLLRVEHKEHLGKREHTQVQHKRYRVRMMGLVLTSISALYPMALIAP